MQRRDFIKLSSLAALAPSIGLVGCDDAPAANAPVDPAPSAPTTGSVRIAYGRDGTGLALRTSEGVVRTLDASGAEDRALAMADHAYPIAATSALDGTIAVVDASNRRIDLYSPDGRSIGAIADDALRAPRDVAFTDDGVLVVADATAHRIVGYSLDGAEVFAFGALGSSGSSLNGPSSVAVSPDGTLVVADRGNARVVFFRTDGTLVAELGRRGRGDGEFIAPRAVACDAAGRVFVADAIRGDVQVFEAGVLVDRVVPQGTLVDVAIKPDGSLYIALA